MIGERIGHYQILEKLGSGGMGEVWLAEDTRLERRVALKFLPHFAAQDETEKARFIQEAKAAARLSHAHIAQIHEIDEEDGRLYIVMEYVAGGSLRDRLDDAGGRPLTLEKVMGWVEQTAEGLAEAHRHGIVHRDIKPDNLMLTDTGQVKITDFGLARLETATRLTASGTTLGTVNYMSPELVTGKDVDHRSDLFSLGATFYELLTGQQVFSGTDATAIFYAILNAEIDPLARYRKDIPDGLEGILDKLLERDPSLRYQSAAEVATDLRRLLGLTTTVSPLSVWRRSFSRALKRIPGFAWVAAVLLMGATALITRQLTESTAIDLSSYRYIPVAVESPAETMGIWLPDNRGIVYQKQLPDGYWTLVYKPEGQRAAVIDTIEWAWKATSLFYSDQQDRLYFTYLGWLCSVGLTGQYFTKYEDIMPILVGAVALSPDENTLACWGRDKETDEWGLHLSSLYPDRTRPPQLYQPFPENISRKVGYEPYYLDFSPDGEKLGFSYFRGADHYSWLQSTASDSRGESRPAERSRSFWVFPIPDGQEAEPYEPFDLSCLSRDDPPSFDWLDEWHVIFSHLSYRPDGGLWIGDIRTGDLQRITVSAIPEMYPSVSPDGTKILHARELLDYDIVEVPLDGSPPRPVLATGMREYSPSLSSNGMTYITDIDSLAEIRIRRTDEDDRVLVNQESFPSADRPVLILPPAVQSPDGNWLVFAGSPGGGYEDITTYFCRTSGGAADRLLEEEGAFARYVSTWSPDSQWLAGMMGRPGEQPTFSKVRIGYPETLTSLDPRELHYPVWSPDGEHIAALTAMGDHNGPLVILTPEGEVVREEWFLSLDEHMGLFWSADSRTLFIYCTDPDFRGLYAFEIDQLPTHPDSSRYDDIEWMIGRYKVADISAEHYLRVPFLAGSTTSARPGRRSFLTTFLKVTSDLWILEGFDRP